MINIHGSCLSYYNKGILILGKSGTGKSDLCLRMIMNKGAKLVADDRVDIYVSGKDLKGRSVSTIAGLLEVRGIGLAKFDYQRSVKINLVIELAKSRAEVDRMPEEEYFEHEGIKIRKIKLYPFDISTPDKIILALSQK